MIWLIGLVMVLLLAVSVIRGAPYVPTHQKQIEIALDLLDLKPGEHLVDVGAGDGKVLLAGARRGLKVTGYEINPLLWMISWIRLGRYRSSSQIIWGDIWRKKLPSDCRAIFVFTMARYLPKLEEKILADGLGGVRLASHGFELPDRKPIETKQAIHLYKID
ncbi:MAG: hypothetical protein R3313_02900 [Candidatus Saccharimonadales bacterium]|nr:hypothetical protein [Candidatus Saccharimonadales bacterium]